VRSSWRGEGRNGAFPDPPLIIAGRNFRLFEVAMQCSLRVVVEIPNLKNQHAEAIHIGLDRRCRAVSRAVWSIPVTSPAKPGSSSLMSTGFPPTETASEYIANFLRVASPEAAPDAAPRPPAPKHSTD
jgi:hypothetical protein